MIFIGFGVGVLEVGENLGIFFFFLGGFGGFWEVWDLLGFFGNFLGYFWGDFYGICRACPGGIWGNFGGFLGHLEGILSGIFAISSGRFLGIVAIPEQNFGNAGNFGNSGSHLIPPRGREGSGGRSPRHHPALLRLRPELRPKKYPEFHDFFFFGNFWGVFGNFWGHFLGPHQSHGSQIQEAEGFGGLGLGLDQAPQDFGSRRLDVAEILGF